MRFLVLLFFSLFYLFAFTAVAQTNDNTQDSNVDAEQDQNTIDTDSDSVQFDSNTDSDSNTDDGTQSLRSQNKLESATASPKESNLSDTQQDTQVEIDSESEAIDSGGAVYDLPEYEVVVTGRRAISKDRTKDAVEIKGEKLRESPKSSALEAISQENAGVYVTGKGALHGVASGATGGIYVRGLGGSPNSQVLVVEDGVPDYQGIFGHPIPDAYVPFLIDDVLVIKGGDSVLYGTNAMGGVIVIRNRWREQDGYEILNDSAYGSYSTLRESVSLLAKHKKFHFAGSFLGLTTDGHRDGAGGNEIVGHLGVRYRFSSHWTLEARNKVIHLEGADPGPATHPNPDHWYDVWRNNSSLRLKMRHQTIRLAITPHFNLGVHRLYDGFYSKDYVAGTNAELIWKAHKKLELLSGLSVQHVGGQVENRIEAETIDVSSLTDFSFYNQLTFRAFDIVSVVLGTRELYSLTYGFVFLYKGGIRLDIYKGLYFKSAVARNFRQPTIRELYLPFPGANPDLRPEFATNVDAQVGYESNRFEVSITGYRTQATDIIKYFGSWPTAEVVNIDHIVIWGIEGNLGLRNIGPFYGNASADFREVGRYTRQNPSLKVDSTLGIEQEFGQHYVAGSICGEWVHGLYMANYKRDPISDVFTMDLSLRYRYTASNDRLTIEPYLFLRNLLDRRYAFVENYPMPGFNVMVGLKLGV